MAAKLRSLGFEVIERANLRVSQIGGTLREFRSKLVPGAVALVFYAGHGLQIKGENYLPAVDAEITGEEDVPNQSLAVRQLMDVLDDAKARLNLVFLDACRNNPYARSFRSASDGLARLSAPSGTLISFATRPGSIAADGGGRNGVYTSVLLEQMKNTSQPIEQVLKRVVTGVKAASNGRQEPWMEGSIEGDFCFGDCATGAAVAAEQVRIHSAAEVEQQLWDAIKDSKDVNDFQEYLTAYSSGRFAIVARARLRTLQTAAPTQVASATPAPAATRLTAGSGLPAGMAPGTVFRDCDACPEMVVIPAGSFQMGSPPTEVGHAFNEEPQHQVTISRAFAVGKYEVTFDEWDACVRENGCSNNASDEGWGRGRRPVINVSWNDAKQYTEWLSRKTGKFYRLLSEAEWEYVARAGTSTAFFFGNTITQQQANYVSEASYAGSPTASSQGKTVSVGSYPANAFGLHDLHGNVREWTDDCWNGTYGGAPTDGSAWTARVCVGRTLRGGSWYSYPRYVRSADRFWDISTLRIYFNGFRSARMLP